MQDLTFGEQVKIILSRKDMTIKELAKKIEGRTGKKMSRQNLTQRLGRDNFQERDMRMMRQIQYRERRMSRQRERNRQRTGRQRSLRRRRMPAPAMHRLSRVETRRIIMNPAVWRTKEISRSVNW